MTIAKYEWTEEQDEFIKKNFRKTKNTKIAENLGLDRTVVERRIAKIIPPLFRQFKNWTSIEDDILFQYYGKVSMEKLCHMLRRSNASILMRLHYLEGSTDMASVGGFLKPSDIATFMGVRPETVRDWINKNILLAYKHEKKFLIEEEYFWNWLKNNTERVNFIKVEEYVLYTVPEWYSEIVKAKQKEIYSDKAKLKYGKPYTSTENALMLNLFDKGWSFKDIANEVDRTKDGVRHQLWRLSKERLEKAIN